MVFGLRLTAAVVGSVAFGLVAATAFPPWSFWGAVLLGFLFGTAFMVGTGYRILHALALRQAGKAPASWSGATCGAALLSLGLWAWSHWHGLQAGFIALAFGIAINLAYLLVKMACLKTGCCRSVRPGLPLDLRKFEIGISIVLLIAATGLASVSIGGAAVLATGGHLAMRVFSRHMRGRWSWGWPPLRQPGAELFPLLLIGIVAAFS